MCPLGMRRPPPLPLSPNRSPFTRTPANADGTTFRKGAYSSQRPSWLLLDLLYSITPFEEANLGSGGTVNSNTVPESRPSSPDFLSLSPADSPAKAKVRGSCGRCAACLHQDCDKFAA